MKIEIFEICRSPKFARINFHMNMVSSMLLLAIHNFMEKLIKILIKVRKIYFQDLYFGD